MLMGNVGEMSFPGVISHKLCFHYTESNLIIVQRRHCKLSEYPNINVKYLNFHEIYSMNMFLCDTNDFADCQNGFYFLCLKMMPQKFIWFNQHKLYWFGGFEEIPLFQGCLNICPCFRGQFCQFVLVLWIVLVPCYRGIGRFNLLAWEPRSPYKWPPRLQIKYEFNNTDTYKRFL